MADYLTNRGVAAGPIYITTIQDKSRQGNWIVSDDSCLHIGKNWKLQSDKNLLSSYSHVLAMSSLNEDDEREPYMLVNAQWVRNYVTGGSGAEGSGSTGVSQTEFNDFKKIVLGTNLSYIAPPVLNVAQDAKTSAIQALTRLDSLDRNTENLQTQITTLQNSFNSHVNIFNKHVLDFENYKENPYPEGVIFIGGGAKNE